MATDLRFFVRRMFAGSGAAAAVLFATSAMGQQTTPTATAQAELRQEQAQPAREQLRDQAKTARDDAREGRQNTREAARDTRAANQDTRQGAREQTRDNREGVRDTREGTRDAAGSQRDSVREARSDVRDARLDMRAERIRSGDLGLWIRRAANRLLVADVAGQGAIAQTGLKEGDQIISIDGQPVATEQEFIDRLFASDDKSPSVPVTISRNGQQQTLQIKPQSLVEEYKVRDANSLHVYGIIIDDSDPQHLTVQAVVPRSPAYYAGVRSGDRITGFRGQRVGAIADLVRAIAQAAGTTAPLQVNRNNQPRDLDIEVPAQGQDEPRTALRPKYPESGAAQPTQPLQPARPQAAPPARGTAPVPGRGAPK